MEKLIEKCKDNKILVSLLKCEPFINTLKDFDCYEEFIELLPKINLYDWFKRCYIYNYGIKYSNGNCIRIGGFTFFNENYRLDVEDGICEDGDFASVRYILTKTEKVYKMKNGKFLNKLLENIPLSNEARIWLCEIFNQERIAFLNKDSYSLHTGKCIEDFYKIYNIEEDFGSCMNKEDRISYYYNCIDTTAAWLEDKNGKVVSRCIIYNKVKDTKNRIYRLAERQYSTKTYLKQLLITALIKENLIDGYKSIYAGAGNVSNYYLNDNTNMPDTKLTIECTIHNNNRLSYQDTFYVYDPYTHTARNFETLIYLNNCCENVRVPGDSEYMEDVLLWSEKLHKRILVSMNSKAEGIFKYNKLFYCGKSIEINGIKVPEEKVVLQYNKKGKYLGKYPSIEAACLHVGGKNTYNIYRCIIGKSKTAYNYIWKYNSI